MSHPTLGIVTNITYGVFQRNVLQGIREVAAQHAYAVIVDALAEEDPAHPRPITLDLSALKGVLVIANAAPDGFIRELYEKGFPVSLVSHQVPDVPVPVVMFNNKQGIAELVKHMVVRCHRRRLVFIRGIGAQSDGIQREQAFRQELMRHNLNTPESHLLRGDFDPEVAAASLRQLIATDAAFDAVIAADYMMANAAVQVLRDTGIQVPEQVSVVGFGDGPEAEEAGLTTVAADVVELGRRAAYQLIGQVKGLRIRGVTVLSVHLVRRETCGCHLAGISRG